jgi:hypothetical protein
MKDRKMEATLLVHAELAKQLEKACSEGIDDCGRSEVIFDREVKFLNGNRMAIRVIAPEEKGECAWTEGVLFDPAGNELGCTHPGEDFLGEYIVFAGKEKYEVEVKER